MNFSLDSVAWCRGRLPKEKVILLQKKFSLFTSILDQTAVPGQRQESKEKEEKTYFYFPFPFQLEWMKMTVDEQQSEYIHGVGNEVVLFVTAVIVIALTSIWILTKLLWVADDPVTAPRIPSTT